MIYGRRTLAAVAALGGMLIIRAAARRMREQRIAGRVVFITGGSRGLGLAIALEAARRGARIAICGRDPERLERAAVRLRTEGAEVLPVRCDLRNRKDVERAIAQTHSHFGRLDVLVNNAGTIAVGPLQTLTREDYEDAMNTHFWSMYETVQAVLPVFRRQGEGRIVNVTSIGARVSVPHLSAYCASKFAAAGHSEGLRAELALENISVTTIFPGLMRTGSPRNAWFKSQNEKEYTWFTLSDTLPGLSIGASSAARTILDAMQRGEAEAVLSLPAKAAVLAHGVAPGLVANAMKIAARMLPKPGGIGARRARGWESASAITESAFTGLGKKAERDYNQIP